MHFGIERIEENGSAMIYLADHRNGTRVGIDPQHGAMLHHFSISVADNRLNVIDSYASEAELEQQQHLSYKSAKLSPFVCRTAEGRYRFDDQEYHFDNLFKDGSAIHGLLSDQPFEETEAFVTENNACLTLQHTYRGRDRGYPFSYTCIVRYTLCPDNRLDIQTTIESHENGPIPIADGWHPYFTLGGNADDWQLQFNSTRVLEFTDKLIPSGKILEDARFKTGISLQGIRLDNCFILDEGKDHQPDCILLNPATGTKLQLFALSGYPYLQVYIPDDRKSIAIEPLSGAPDCFNNHMGLIRLKGKIDFRLRLEVR